MDSGISMPLWDVPCCTFSMRWGKMSGTLWHVPQCTLWYMKGIPKSHGTAVGNAAGLLLLLISCHGNNCFQKWEASLMSLWRCNPMLILPWVCENFQFTMSIVDGCIVYMYVVGCLNCHELGWPFFPFLHKCMHACKTPCIFMN